VTIGGQDKGVDIGSLERDSIHGSILSINSVQDGSIMDATSGCGAPRGMCGLRCVPMGTESLLRRRPTERQKER
jgi:hypothetical protein